MPVRTILTLTLVATAASAFPGPTAGTRGSLSLEIDVAKDVRVGEVPRLAVVLANRGEAPITVFHPDSMHKVWGCWQLDLEVTRPDGRTFVLAPDIVFAMVPMPRDEHYRTVLPGAELRIGLDLDGRSADASGVRAGWVALVPVSDLLAERLPTGVLQLVYGVRGEGYLISGGGHSLALYDLPANVFPGPGSYPIRASFRTTCAHQLRTTLRTRSSSGF